MEEGKDEKCEKCEKAKSDCECPKKEELGDGKTQGTDSKDAGLDNNDQFTGKDFAAEKGEKEKRAPATRKTKSLKNIKFGTIEVSKWILTNY